MRRLFSHQNAGVSPQKAAPNDGGEVWHGGCKTIGATTATPTTRERENIMEKNHTRKYLQIQGFNLDDDALAEIGPWMRWPYVFCASILTVGVVLASPWIIWSLAAIAISTVFLPSHPFNYVYNYGVRRLTGTRALPPGTAQGKFHIDRFLQWCDGTHVGTGRNFLKILRQ